METEVTSVYGAIEESLRQQEPAPASTSRRSEPQAPHKGNVEDAAKVLVATAMGPGKEYTRPFLLTALRSLQTVTDMLIVLDGVEWTELQTMTHHEDGGLLHDEHVLALQDPGDVYWKNAATARCAVSREEARQFFLKGDWTHLYFHDSDMISPSDIIPKLLAHNVDAATGLYNLRGNLKPWIPGSISAGKGRVGPLGSLLGLPNAEGHEGCYWSAHFGMGCTLMSRRALEAVPFRTAEQLFSRRLVEDTCWGVDLTANLGERVLLDPSLSCWHVEEDGWATRLDVGDMAFGAAWDDTPTFVTNKFGEWKRGEVRTDLTEAQLSQLPPGFLVGPFPRMAVEVKRITDLLG